jgi:hypothetical protein
MAYFLEFKQACINKSIIQIDDLIVHKLFNVNKKYKINQIINSCDQVINSCDQVIDSCDQVINSCDQVINSCDQVINSCDHVINSCDQVINSSDQVITIDIYPVYLTIHDINLFKYILKWCIIVDDIHHYILLHADVSCRQYYLTYKQKYMQRNKQILFDINEYLHDESQALDLSNIEIMNYACTRGHLYVIKYLHEICGMPLDIYLNIDGKINRRYNTYFQLIHLASIHNCVNIVDYLYKHGVSLEIYDNKGKQPIQYAMDKNHIDLIKYIISQDYTSYHIVDNMSKNLLHHATIFADTEMTNKLLTHCPTLCLSKDNEGKIPLHYACIHGHMNMIQLFMNYAHVHSTEYIKMCDIPDNDGKLPMHYICINLKLQIFKMLIDKYGNKIKYMLNIPDNTGKTCIQYMNYEFLHEL